ncbi:MAG: UDPGP type 1 family protein [Clostridium sp.]|nr:UDPGP type 1 family protein [Clostridium sp.]MCM1399084.1 UDPGP type 1 family protein [Clostridium sp.]MCM1459476.1 UDPGP type 1 family protein [Bacteroides sp.]
MFSGTVNQSKLDTAKTLLKEHNQEHLLKYADELSQSELSALLAQINAVDWGFNDCSGNKKLVSGTIEPMGAHSLDAIKDNYDSYAAIGTKAIKAGKLCLLLLAGGQGTRLGYDKPKGSFNMGINRDLFIFQLLIEHTLDVVRLTDTWIHLYIMTSDINYEDTTAFFKEHDYFGYNSDYIHFFIQELNPTTDLDGKILMNSKCSISMSPNGNGGWFSSMHKAGLLDDIFDSDLKWINVFAVDNVLQRIADPVFLGATIASNKMCGAKVIRKNAPDEKVGAMCLENGKPHIIEYYELSDEMKNQTNPDGSLAYGFGVILNYLFPIHRLKETLNIKMPLHIVKKAIPHIDENGHLVEPDAPNGLKYETLALDLIHEMDDCLVFEVERSKEFAPVKNKTGIDSVDSARELLVKNGYDL